jgi:hypothetical protein
MTDVGRPAPEVYRQSVEKLPLAVGRAMRLAALNVVGVATALSVLATPLAETSSEAVDAALLIAVVALLALPYVLWRARRRVRRYWNAFELTIGPGTVRCAAKGSGRITIRREEIVALTEGAHELVVRSAQPGVVVRVPITVEAYVDARARLAAWHALSERPDDGYWCAGLLGLAGVVAGVVLLARRAPALAAPLVVCQLSLALFAAGEIGANPQRQGVRKAVAVSLALASAFPPLLAALR